MSEDLTGRRLGHYRIDGVLGRGGMSVMYRATDIRLGRKVALKVIAEHLTEDPEFRERFVDEARNTSAVDHSNVVPLYDFGEVDGLLFIAMRLVDGSDLASLISSGPLAPQRAIALLGQIGDALDMLHGRGLVHLDVKPANVLVTTREAAGEHVYLADFGLTRRGATGHRTRCGDFLGSPTYAAPEHLRGEPVDARTDVYSLACVLFACLAGRPPYTGSVPEVIQGHLSGAVPAVSSAGAVSADLDEVLRRGMAKQQDGRYGSCRELINTAREALGHREPFGRPAFAPPTNNGRGQTGGSFQPRRFAPPPGYGAPGQQRVPSYPPSGVTQPMADPVRLRPPVPARSSHFSGEGSTSRRWVLPALLLALVVVAVVVILLVVTSGGSGGNGGGGGGGGNGNGNGGTSPVPSRLSSLPNVPVGPGNTETGSRPLPTSVPIEPR